MFAESRVDRMPSAEIAEALGRMEDRPWSEWKAGKPVTPRQLARLLEPFKISPGSIRIADTVAKGYRLDQFTEVFRRYIPDLSVTRLQVQETAGFRDSASVTSGLVVTDLKPPNPAESLVCNRVTDGNPKQWEAEGNGQSILLPDEEWDL